MKVLVVENDPSLGPLVEEILVEAGYATVLLPDGRPASVRALVKCVEPDCVLLDGGGRSGYDDSWEIAAWLRDSSRPVPAILFTVDADAVWEANAGTSARSHDFAAVVTKPFGIDDLVATVARVAAAGPKSTFTHDDSGAVPALLPL